MSQTDVRKTIPANSGMNVPVRGEFVFLKSAPGRVRVTINNEAVEMEAGDVRRVTQPFNSFEAFNLSGVEKNIEFVVGFGDYNRLVVRGDISSFPSIIGSDGIARPDNRKEIAITTGLVIQNEQTFAPFANVAQMTESGFNPEASGNFFSPDGLLGMIKPDNSKVYSIKYDPKTGQEIRRYPVTNYDSNVQHIFNDPVYGEILYYVRKYRDDPAQFIALGKNRESPVFLNWQADTKEYSSVIALPNGLYMASGTGSIALEFRVFNSLSFDNPLAIWTHTDDLAPNIDGAYSLKSSFPSRIEENIIYIGAENGYHKMNILTGEIQQVTSGSDEWRTHIIDHETGKVYRWKDDNNGRVYEITETELFTWGRGNGKRTNYPADKNTGSETLQKNQEIEGQVFDQSSSEWTADIIKQALFWQYKKSGKNPAKIPSNYMDYIFGMSINGNTIHQNTYESLQRLKKVDFHTIRNPSMIKLIVDSRII